MSLALRRLFLISWLFIFTISCAEGLINEDPSVESSAGQEQEQGSCPPEYLRDDGTCWISDPSGYNDYVETMGEAPPVEDLLYVDETILQEQEQSFLVQEGAGKHYVYINQSKRIGIRAINNVGLPVPGIRVSFEISTEGTSDARGSTLSLQMAESDQYGVASVEITGGPVPTFFKLTMTSDATDSIDYQINVIQPNISDDTNVANLPPGQQCNILNIEGNYEITSHYELGRFLGDDVFNTIQTINRALTDPGGLIGDWIRDQIGGFVGDALRGVVRDIVNSLLRGLNLPAWAETVVTILEDVTGLLTDLEIKGNMRLGAPSGDECEVPGVHAWEQLIFRWQGDDCGGAFGGNQMCGEHPINLSEIGVSASESEFKGRIVSQNALFAELEIEEHALQMNIGVIMITLLQTVILPNRSNVSSIGDLIASIFPCSEFGRLAENLVGGIPFIGGGVRSLAESACQSGIRALGNELTGRLIGQLEVDTFRVKGRCKLRSTDQDPQTEEIFEGRWEEDPNSNNFLQGDFEGTLR